MRALVTNALTGLCIALALGLAACAPSQSNPSPSSPSTTTQAPGGIVSGPGVEATDVAACTAKGGALQRICRMGNIACVITYEDANKSCTDGSQCASGRCLVEYNATNDPTQAMRGVCKKTSDPCGCNTPMENGKPGPTLCVD